MIPLTTDLGGCKLDPSNKQDDVPTSSEAKYNGRHMVCFSTDGRYLMTNAWDMTLRIYWLNDERWEPTIIDPADVVVLTRSGNSA